MNNEVKKLSDLIRLVDDKIDDLDIEKRNYHNVIFVSDSMLNCQKYILLIITVFGMFFGGITNLNNLFSGMLYGGVSGLVGSLIPVIFSYIFFGGFKLIYKKKLGNLEKDISTYNVLRKFYNNELTKAKNNELGFEPMETIDLDYEKEYNKLIGRETVLEKKESKPKKLVLKKR